MKGARDRWSLPRRGARLEHTAFDLAFKVEQAHQRVRVGDPQVVARQDAQPAAAGQQVAEVLEYPIDTARERERDNDVGVVGGGEMGDDVREERVVAARDEIARDRPRRAVVADLCRTNSGSVVSGFSRTSQIIATSWNNVADAAARVGDVVRVARDDVDVQVEDRLARRGADVDADVEAVGRVAAQIVSRAVSIADVSACRSASVASNQLATWRLGTSSAWPLGTQHGPQRDHPS
jgi:hypothetical protein